MTVYNSARFLTKTLESLLAQDYRNFELIISDNASDDGSSEICREFAKRDNRIRYFRNSINMGPVRNSYKAVDLCTGDFIMVAADHDAYHPCFISRLLEMLQQDESVVLAYPRTFYIDENDQILQLTPDAIDTRGLDAGDRFRKCIWECFWMNMVYGLYRSAAFRTVWHAHPTIGPDHVVVAHLSLLGTVAQVDEPLFFRRQNRPVENSEEMTNRQIASFAQSNFDSLIPWTRMAYEHVKVVNESQLTDKEKESLYQEIRKCFPTRFGDAMRSETTRLITEGKQTLLGAHVYPHSCHYVKSELIRIASICRFFYPDDAELDTFLADTIYTSEHQPAKADTCHTRKEEPLHVRGIQGGEVPGRAAKTLSLMQVHGFYPSYIDTFYGDHPETAALPFIEQTNRLVRDGYSANHIIAPYMDQFGYETHLMFANNPFAQEKWMTEQGFQIADRKNWVHEIIRRQIDTIKPDILYLSDPITFESSFVRTLSWKPALIVGWRAANIPEGTDWTEFDVMLSSLASLREVARLLGAKRAEQFHPGYPAWINGLISDQNAEYDVVFSGSWTSGQHVRRNAYLEHIAAASEQNGFTCAYYLAGELHAIPPAVARFNKGERFGVAMHRALRTGKIVIDARGILEIKNVGNAIDLAKTETANMRIFEVTGGGCFLLTEYHENLQDYFLLGEEIETFRNERELIDKINYYLAHPAEREAIARRGQERCLRDYSMEMQARKFDTIVRNALKDKTAPEDLYDMAYRWGWSKPELKQLVYLCFKTPDFADNARRFFMNEGFKEAVLLLSSLGKPPRRDIKLLDLGCGNGVAAYALARGGYDVTGLDSSLGELAGLKAAGQLIGLDGAKFALLHTKGEFLDFPDESFDVIWMREVLHHIRDLDAFMKEAARILKPGGVICCLREHVIWNESQREHFFRTHPFYHITRDEGCYYLDEYLNAFKGAHLSVEKLLAPADSVINTYPAPFTPGLTFDPEAAKCRAEGNDLFSFFAKKPLSPARGSVGKGDTIETGNSVILDAFNLRASGLHEGRTYFRTGNDCMIGVEVQILSPDAEISVGDRVYLSAGSRIACCNRIEFGNDILVAWGCTFIDHDSYPADAAARKAVMNGKLERLRSGEKNWERPEAACVTRGKITIQDNAWIGMNCVILGGVTIGEGAVVGACSVVTEDVEPWTVVIGNPARRII